MDEQNGPRSIGAMIKLATRYVRERDFSAVWCEDGSGNEAIVLRGEADVVQTYNVRNGGVTDVGEIRGAIEDGIDPAMLNDNGSIELVKGAKYAVESLRVWGWTEGDGSGTEGYRLADFFEADGTYRGPDQHGIEPIAVLRDDD